MGTCKLSIICCKSKKSGTLYQCLVADFGWQKKYLSFDQTVLLGFVPLQQLSAMKADDVIELGEVDTLY